MDRRASLARVTADEEPWDLAVIGGGATGLGIAVDAASRGYRVCLLEQSDLGKGTSSRSTKLIHGGIRYLRQGHVGLVREALLERGILRRNAAHLVHEQAFVVPVYAGWEKLYYGLGLRFYDLLARGQSFGASRVLSVSETLANVPTLEPHGLRGGVLYFDGQFDDARLVIDLAQTAEGHGAAVVNYAPVTAFTHDRAGHVNGLAFQDGETRRVHRLRARGVINATGPFADGLRRLDEPGTPAMLAPSQGVHVVLDRSFLPGDAALIVPRTADRRVLFAIPWHGYALVGTTDTPVSEVTLEPRARQEEIDFILDAVGRYLVRRPGRGDIRSVFAGIRPLVAGRASGPTASLSREHTIEVGRSGLVSIVGGKWTTYRKMAQECVDRAAAVAGLPARACVTATLPIHGAHPRPEEFGDLWYYGTAAAGIGELMRSSPELARRLHPALPICAGQVVWAVRKEMARTVDDVLSRRTRALALDARAALAMAPDVAALMAAEMERDASWQREQIAAFAAVAAGYLV